MARPFFLGSALLALLGACAGESFDLPAGATCERSIQCATGLACVVGVCSDDPTGIGGMVPENPDDPGAGVDAGGEVDAATPPSDAGSTPPPPPPPPPPMDAGADGG